MKRPRSRRSRTRGRAGRPCYPAASLCQQTQSRKAIIPYMRTSAHEASGRHGRRRRGPRRGAVVWRLPACGVAACGTHQQHTAPVASSSGGDDRASSATRPRRPSTTTPSSPAFQKTSAGRGRRASRTRSAPRATSRARSRPASRPTSSTSRSSPTCSGWSTTASSPTTGTSRVQRVRRGLGRDVRRPQGQPEGHPQLGRPGQAGRRGRSRRTRSSRAAPSGT